MASLARRLVVVTGGAQGIGRAIVQGFAAEGSDVVAADINVHAGQELEREAAAEWDVEGAVKFVHADFSRTSAACAEVFEEAQAWGGQNRKIDVLVNNVGVQTDNNKPVHILTEEV